MADDKVLTDVPRKSPSLPKLGEQQTYGSPVADPENDAHHQVTDNVSNGAESSHSHDHQAHSHSHDGEAGSHHTHSHHGRAPFTEDEELEERQHFETVVAAFRYYRTHAMKKIARQRNHYQSLTKPQGERLPQFMDHLDALRQCTAINQQFLDKILLQTPFDNTFGDTGGGDGIQSQPVSTFHMDKVHTTLRMFVRDWSREGQTERQQAYEPLVAAVEKYFPKDKCDVSQIQILNPGAGLGRLPWEFARRGYTSIGNEFSLYMLLASNFILNCCQEVDGYKIYPWIGHASNNLSSANQMIGISIPDISPTDLPPGHNFGMVAGDFLEVFDRNETWDCVVTCFFIDTARNVLEYVEHIWHLLKPGGYWMNLGPLLYHFADIPHESCLELTYEHVKTVIKNTGFQMLEEKTDIPCSYVQNPYSMLRYEYRCVSFVCHKPDLKASFVDASGNSLS
ncbi:carnosine N-methyltransferase-like [Paramacrobiotus metropolitanus]|uniref:carnosine N-methyltransferase-like n=1 Tax=Paramacrobiotus metropolitanus TaxID=2943436 RepID=UPI0024462315|nr:carnosine N-methyltransferase-like [Paramacrobiotus metropolitanus]